MMKPEALHPQASGRKTLAFILPDMTGGGAERIALRLMRDALAAGHRVDLVLQSATGELLKLLPPEVRIVDLGAARLRSALFPLIGYFRRSRPDGGQAFMWPLTVVAIAAHRLARSRTRLVVSDHTILSRHLATLGASGRWIAKTSIRLLYPQADARVAVSSGGADDLAEYGGLKRSSIEIIYNPIAGPAKPPVPDPEVERLWGPSGGRILTVGKLKPEKNHALLIRSFARLLRHRPAKLMILGYGPLREETERLIADQGLSEHVLLPGFKADLWPYYASADLFALTSDYEGFGNVLVEAMHCGIPAISTDCPSGPREILDGGRYGLLVQPDDEEALADALEAGLERQWDHDALIARARELSGPDTSERYLALMLGEPAGAAASRHAL